jgi:LCP family protein required for cell wall assembly
MEFSINMSDKELETLNKHQSKRPPVKDIKPKTPKIPKVRKKHKRTWIFILLGLILASALSVGGYMVYKGYKLGKDIGFQIKPSDIFTPPEKPELKKDSTGKYTTVMLIGLDTRENTQLLNTDSIMTATYNYETNDVTMLSIPRDLHVQVNPKVVWFNKINSVYATNEQKVKGSGLEALKDVVEDVTGLEIQYSATIDYKGFVELIDAIGGIYVNVENSFTDYMYPASNLKYQTVKFQEGPQLMDGETALKYSRSRHSMNNGEGSDYARARRQQNVIVAFKDTILTSETLLNPKKIMDLISAVQNNLKISAFTITDIEAGVNLLQEFSDAQGRTYSFVLDPSAGNSTLIKVGPNPNEEYYIYPANGNGKYENIHEYIKLIVQDPQLYSEDPAINVYNTGLGYQDTYKVTQELREQFPYMNIKFLGTLYSDKEGKYIYPYKEGEKTYSLDKLSKYLKIDTVERPEYIKTNINGADISILLGKEITPQVNQ